MKSASLNVQFYASITSKKTSTFQLKCDVNQCINVADFSNKDVVLLNILQRLIEIELISFLKQD